MRGGKGGSMGTPGRTLQRARTARVFVSMSAAGLIGVAACSGSDSTTSESAADATTVERHAHQGPDAHLVPEVLGDQVVEGLLERGLVDDDPGDSLAQRESADFRSSTRGVASHENSFSERPKCP